MVKNQKNVKGSWLVLAVLSLASILFTGCNNGSLGIKGGVINGYVINATTNRPIADVLVIGKGTVGDATENQNVYTGGDGSFVMSDLTKGEWSLFVDKYGYSLVSAGATGTDTTTITAATVSVNNGETVTASVIKMNKTSELYKGILKGYPIDAITGRPLMNFTITQTEPYLQRKSKLFESASYFRDSGWTGLEGGNHHYTIAAKNYKEYSTAGLEGGYNPPISIGASPVDLGIIMVEPLTISISGTLQNLPGYILDAGERDIVIWAESAGKIVASFTDSTGQDAYKGSVIYKLDGVPVTSGSVSVKCKIRGYNVETISHAVSLSATTPGGTVAGIDIDFDNIEPITRALRVVVTGSEPSDDELSSFESGHVARVYIRQGGNNLAYVDVTSLNYRGEAVFSNVITGYDLNIYVVNQNAGFNNVLSENFIIQEGNNSLFTFNVEL